LQTCPVYVYDGTKLLQSGKDYTLSDYKTVKANSAQVTVKAVESGNYTGSVVAKLAVYEEGVKIISPENVKLKETAVAYTGKAVKPEVTVTVDGTALTNKDYKVQYQNNKDAGTAYVIVTGKGNYAGLSAATKFTINPQQIKKASLKGTQGNLVLMYSKRKLKEGTDYEKPEYGAANKNKVSVTIKGKGDFTGEMTKTVKVQ